MVQQCSVCAKEAATKTEPLKPTALPSYPWQVLGSDLFELQGTHYLVIVDYFSRYPEVVKLTTTTSSAIIAALKAVFSRHGILETLRSDNGPQYAAQEFQEFVETYGFQHTTSSPRYPQSNGQAERTVQTVKQLLKKQLQDHSADPYMALLTYRTTPLTWCGLSPDELLMGRRLRTSLPQTDKLLIPEWSYLPEFKNADDQLKTQQKRDFDKRHRAHELPDLHVGTHVWVKTGEQDPIPGRVVGTAARPRSYVVDVPTGQLERNRKHLTVIPDATLVSDPEDDLPQDLSDPLTQPSPKKIMTRSQTGTKIIPPDRLGLKGEM